MNTTTSTFANKTTRKLAYTKGTMNKRIHIGTPNIQTEQYAANRTILRQLNRQGRPNHARYASIAKALAEPEVEVKSNAAPDASPILICGQVSHSLTKEREELILGMSDWVTEEVMPILKPVDKCWQPADILPEPSKEEFFDEIREIRERTLCLPDEYLVVLVGDMITEEALPTYMTMLNNIDATKDETGMSSTPWATWTRAWTVCDFNSFFLYLFQLNCLS